jgi:hypothetical protein
MAVSKAFTPFRIILAVQLLFLCATTAQAQLDDDWHMFSRDLFVRSAFAHGYMHGYEDGFHNGDLDLQMGRLYRDVKSQSDFKKPPGYRNQFGDKDIFQEGYRTGFRVGYIDCFSGRNFRAAQLLNLSRQTRLSRESLRFDKNFDHAFRQGYESGQRQGLADGRVSDVSLMDPSTCQLPSDHGAVPADYCDAFRDGYQLGYSDGYTNQRGSGDVFARNGTK